MNRIVTADYLRWLRRTRLIDLRRLRVGEAYMLNDVRTTTVVDRAGSLSRQDDGVAGTWYPTSEIERHQVDGCRAI
jgi:hypothetical protein